LGSVDAGTTPLEKTSTSRCRMHRQKANLSIRVVVATLDLQETPRESSRVPISLRPKSQIWVRLNSRFKSVIVGNCALCTSRSQFWKKAFRSCPMRCLTSLLSWGVKSIKRNHTNNIACRVYTSRSSLKSTGSSLFKIHSSQKSETKLKTI
jgi:hypothetical protein